MEVGRNEFQDLRKEVVQTGNAVSALQVEVKNLRATINDLVTKAEFFPVKAIAYGLAVGSMSAVVTAVISGAMMK